MSQVKEAMTAPAHLVSITAKFAHLARWFSYISIVLLVTMMFLTVSHGLGRYLFKRPVTGLVEISSFLLLTATFFMLANTEMADRHVAIDMVTMHYPKRVQAAVESISYILCLAFTGLMLWQTILRVQQFIQKGNHSTILATPFYPFVIILAVGWTLYGIAVLLKLIRFLKSASGRTQA